MTTNDDIEGWGVENDLFNGHYRENPCTYTLFLHNHKTNGVAINKVRNIINIVSPKYITSLFMKFHPNCCQNHDREPDHNQSTKRLHSPHLLYL